MKSCFFILLCISSLCLVNCSARYTGGDPGRLSRPSAHPQARIQSLLAEADVYAEQGLYALASERVYHALLLLTEAKADHPEQYGRLLDMAMALNFKMRLSSKGRSLIVPPREDGPGSSPFAFKPADAVTFNTNYIDTLYLMGGEYVPWFRSIMNAHGLPQELALLPAVESGFHVTARSPKGALGMWQFLAPTARQYGLMINLWVDQRLDPIASCYAAARYLRYLYATFGSYELALAAYNCGEGRLQRVIDQAGTTDMGVILQSPLLPRETRNYVAAFVCLLDHVDWRRFPSVSSYLWQTVPFSIRVKHLLPFLRHSREEFLALNPAIKRDIIPPAAQGFPVLLTRDAGALTEVPGRLHLQWGRFTSEKKMKTTEIARALGVPCPILKAINNVGDTVAPGATLIYPL